MNRPADDNRWVVTCLINTAEGNFAGFRAEHETALAYDIALVYTVEADSPTAAAEAAFAVGNRMADDADGKEHPSWVRSISVGDVLLVRGWSDDDAPDLAVAPVGFTPVALVREDTWNRPGGRAKMAAAGHASAE
jgi:hypothetical protein